MKQEDTKKKILEKALELFSMHGYDSVSVGEIAKTVGIKAPSLYNHYPSKNAIFEAIVEDTTKKYEKYTDEINFHIQDSNRDIGVFSEISEELLIEKVKQIFTYSLHDKTISRFRKMMTIEQFRSPELSALYSNRYVDRVINYHEGIFKSLISAGVLKNENANVLSIMYTAPIITLLGVCDRQPEKESECLEKLDTHVRFFYHTFNNKAKQTEI